MYERILVPTDGSPSALAAARYGLGIAAAFDASVELLSVVDTRQFSDQLAAVDPLVRDQREGFERRAREAVDDTIDHVKDIGLEPASVIRDGVPHDVIRRHGVDHEIDLICMGTHGRSGLDRFLVGSVAERVIRTSGTPVLAVPPDTAGRDGPLGAPVLLPTDGSPAAEASIPHALALAERFDVPLHVLTVIMTGGGLPELGEPDSEAAWDVVGALAERAIGRDVEVETHVRSGDPHEEIRRFVRSHDVGLVTMGTHGRTGLSRHLLGSVTEKTLRTSDVPVLTAQDLD